MTTPPATGPVAAAPSPSAPGPGDGLVPASTGSAVRVGVLTASGLAPHEIARAVRTGARSRVRRGVVTTGPVPAAGPAATDALATAAVLLVPGSWVSHAVAARLHGLRSLREPERVCVTRPRRDGSRRAPCDSRVHLHQAALGVADVMDVGDVPVTSPGRTVADLLRSLSAPDALALADEAVRVGCVGVETVAEVLDRQVRWRGSRSAARVLKLADGRVESPLESRVRGWLVLGCGLPVPAVQPVVVGASGRRYRADLAWLDQGVVLEVDGRVKYSDPYPAAQAGRDAGTVLWREKRREDDLRDAGWEVVRAVSCDVGDAGLGHRVRVAAHRFAGRTVSRPRLQVVTAARPGDR